MYSIKLIEALDDINKAHDLLSKTGIDMKEYNPISSKLVRGKVKLAEYIAEVIQNEGKKRP